jgi:hypothetical protein
MFITKNSLAQFTFTVNPGINYNGATFGLKSGKWLPYGGVTYFGGTSKVTYTDPQFNNSTSQIEDVKDEYKFSGNIIIPTIGTRFYVKNGGDLKAFFNANITKPIITAKYIENGVEEKEVTDYVRRISLWAGEVGFGAEYHFASSFSISGEFGFRWIAASYENSWETQVYNPNTGTSETHDRSINSSAFLSPTYTRMSLNFYFGEAKKKSKTEEE